MGQRYCRLKDQKPWPVCLHVTNYNSMKNVCVLKTTISVFRWIIIGPYYVGRETQCQLKCNEKLVYFENDNFNFSSDYCWHILRWPWNTKPTKFQRKSCVFFENGHFSFSSDYCWHILRWPWNINPTKLLQKTCAFRKWPFQFFVGLSLAYVALAMEHKAD